MGLARMMTRSGVTATVEDPAIRMRSRATTIRHFEALWRCYGYYGTGTLACSVEWRSLLPPKTFSSEAVLLFNLTGEPDSQVEVVAIPLAGERVRMTD